jgi:outer membrane protein assembly factor BamB/predicted Zn-dependent protease/tRNA A-37 threonylcarbamoyl transferase component Bud32
MVTPLAPGTKLKNRYQIIRLLGRGGQCIVYQICDQFTGQNNLVLKCLIDQSKNPQEKAQNIQLFMKEHTFLSKLNHPSLPKAYEYFQEMGTHFLVVEFVPGQSLEKTINSYKGPVPEKQVIEWMTELTKTLVYLSHQKPNPIVVRDIKPSNIQHTPDGKVKFIDFTIAREWKPNVQDTVRMGSPGYAAPEQYKGRSDIRSDIFSLGVTMYEAITKKDPTETPFNFLPVRKINPSVSEELEKIFLKTMENDADKRYQTPKELLEDLKALAYTRSLSGPDKAKKFFSMGEQELLVKNYKKALEYYQSAAQSDPSTGEYLCRSGEMYYYLGNMEKGLLEIYRGMTAGFKGILVPAQINEIRGKFETIKKQLVKSWPMFSKNAARTACQNFDVELISPLANLWKNDHFDIPPKSSPSVGDGMLFTGTKTGKLLCIDINNGSLKWAFDTGKPVISSPCYYKGMVYFGSNDTNVYALQASNGRKIWQFKTQGAVFSSPAICDDILYIGSSDNKLYALTNIASTVRKLWEFDSRASIISSPAIYEENVFFGNMSASIFSVNAKTGQTKWIFDAGSPVSSTPSIENNILYTGSFDGKFYAVDINTGRMRWIYNTGSKIETNAAAGDSMVYITSTDMNVYGLDAFKGTKIWSYQTDAPILSSPALANKTVFVITNYLYCIDAKRGQLLWKTKVSGPTHASPAIANSILYFSSGNTLYSYVSSAAITIKYFEEGNNLFKSGQYFKAADSYRHAVSVERKKEYLQGLAKSCYLSEDEKLFDEAVAVLQELLKIEYSADYSVMIGDIMFRKNNYDTALTNYRNGVKINDNLDWPHFRIGLINYKFKAKPDEAIKEIQKAININPSNPVYLKTLGDLYESINQPYEAIKFYTKVLVIKPNDPDIKAKLTSIRNIVNAKDDYEKSKKLLKEGKLEEAIKKLENAIKLAPDKGEYRIELGKIKGAYHFEQGKKYLSEGDKKFLEEFREALAIDPENREYLMETGKALMELMEKEVAFREETNFNYTIEILKKLGNHLLLGDCFFLYGKYEEALSSYNKSSITVDGIVEYKKSHCYLKTDNIGEAIKAIDKAIDQSPGNGTYYKELGFLLLKINKESEAIIVLNKALELDPTNAEISAKLKEIGSKYEDAEKIFSEGEEKLLLNQFDDAIKSFSKVIGLVPGVAKYYLKLGEAYLYSKKLTEAEMMVNRALKLSPEDHSYIILLGDILVARGNIQKGIELYKKAISKSPKTVDYYLKLGEAYERLENIEEALEVFQSASSINQSDENIKQRIEILLNRQGKKRWSMLGRDNLRQSCQETENTMSPPAILRWSFLKENWVFETGGKIRSSPVVDYGILYTGSSDNNLYAIDIETGEKKWQNITGGPIQATPVVYRNYVYCGSTDNILYAFEAISGRFLWKFNTGSPVISSPLAYKDFIYIINEKGNIFSLDINSGAQKWSKPLPCPAHGSPSLDKDILYTGGMNGKIYALNSYSGELLWEQNLGGKITSSIVISENFLYVGTWNKIFYSMKKENGEVAWTFNKAGRILSSAAFDGRAVYFGSEDRKIYSLNASNGELIWEFKTKGKINSCPALANNLLYTGSDDGKIYALETGSGRPWEYQTKGPVMSSPAIAEGMLFIGSDDGKIYCFCNYKPDETPLPTSKEEDKGWWKIF